MPIFFINESENQSNYKKAIFTYFRFEAILTFCLCLPSMLFFKSKPEYPPR